jgi:non-specific serine/threonine protein kinase/serine/threonine-protein kinase
VKSITADALERPEADRGALVAAACAGDEALRAEVESLLRADARAAGFLAVGALESAGAAEAVARTVEDGTSPAAVGLEVGPYRILRELGRGGMGVVYLAERADAAFEKQVAIKVVRAAAFAGEALLGRFREERRILATLDHPNIARLLDAGTTADGLPYLVMEHVDGVPVDVYCAAAGVTLAQRLALFARVCAAVEYAHQRLVIHRDLKAKNVLVTPDGTPKLLDFGIAKLLDAGVAPEEQTRTGLRALTLDSASPEQVRGEPLTVTSDVYALGVLLYRLLCGRGPYGTRRTEAELMRAICEEIPPRPSAAAALPHRRALRGELDWITMKALRKEPDRRYPSVERLAEDVRRHLAGHPVAAAPDSWSYRAGKFARRHRVPIAAGALLLASIGAGMAATLWQARRADEQRARAERRFADVRQLANAFLFEHDEAIRNLPGATPARALLVRRALEYLDGLSREAGDDRSLRRELAAAYQKVGRVQSDPSGASLGDSAGAAASYGKALGILAALAEDDPRDLRVRRDLADCHAAIGDLEWTAGKGIAAALRSYREALALREALSAADPSDVEARIDVVKSLRAIGDVTDPSGVLHYQRAADLSEALFAEDPANKEVRTLLASIHERIGADLAARGESARALSLHARAADMRRALLSEDPANVSLRRMVAASCFQIGAVLDATGDAAGAVKSYREMLGIYGALAAADPTDAQARGALATAHLHIGRVTARTDPRAALASYRAALAIAERLRAADPGNMQIRYSLAMAHRGLGEVTAALAAGAGLPRAARVRHWREARGWFQQSLHTFSDMQAHDHLSQGEGTRAVRALEGEIARCERALQGMGGRR